MHVVTTTNLLSKYNITADVATALLTKLSPTVTILPPGNCNSIKAFTDPIQDSILLIGGNDVVPFWTLPNPCNDPDQSLQSDAPYACVQDQLFMIPDKIVGRIPDEDNGHQYDFLTTVIENQRQHLIGPPGSAGWFNMVASVWQNISSFMGAHFSMQNQNVVPPVVQGNLQASQILGKKYHYLNLHGTNQTPFFYGQLANNYPIALGPTSGYFKDGVVVAESCYGSYLNARNRNTSILLQALFSGAVAFVGGTGIQYGPATSPPDGVDYLSYSFYTKLLSGMSIGQAFMEGKKQFITDLIQSHGNLEPSNKKTILQTMLYGVPDIKL